MTYRYVTFAIAASLACTGLATAQQAYLSAPASDATPDDVTAVQAPWSRPDIEIGHRDRLYVSDVTGERVCAVDPAKAELLGCLPGDGTVVGEPAYAGRMASDVSYAASRNGRLLARIRPGRRSVTVASTEANATIQNLTFETAPASVVFTPNGRELWVSLTDENAVAVFDTRTFREIARLAMADGPGSIAISENGRHAFVASTQRAEIRVTDVRRRIEAARLATTEVGMRHLAITPDGKDLWGYLEEGGLDVFSTRSGFRLRRSVNIDSGIASLAFAHVSGASLAYAASPDLPLIGVFDVDSLSRVGSVPLPAIARSVWQSGDGTAIFAALPTVGELARIATTTNHVTSTLTIPDRPAALIYVPGAVRKGLNQSNLTPASTNLLDTAGPRSSASPTSTAKLESSLAKNIAGK